MIHHIDYKKERESQFRHRTVNVILTDVAYFEQILYDLMSYINLVTKTDRFENNSLPGLCRKGVCEISS